MANFERGLSVFKFYVECVNALITGDRSVIPENESIRSLLAHARDNLHIQGFVANISCVVRYESESRLTVRYELLLEIRTNDTPYAIREAQICDDFQAVDRLVTYLGALRILIMGPRTEEQTVSSRETREILELAGLDPDAL